MAKPGDRLREPSGVEIVYVETAGSTGGRRLGMEWTIPAGRRLVARAHRHPDGPEGWDVLEGAARYKVGRDERAGEVGDAWEIPGNTAHVHPWNAGDGYFETLMAFAQRGETDDKFDIRSPLQAALSIREL